jgi:hypothetical protein
MSEFEKAATGGGGFLGDVWDLLRREKKWWLIPLIVVLLAVAGLMALASTAAAPFIYTLF